MKHTIISVSERETGRFSLQESAVLSGMHPHLILDFVRAGYVRAARVDASGIPEFDERGILRLRRMEDLRSWRGMNLRTLRYIVQLLNRLETTEREVAILRERLR